MMMQGLSLPSHVVEQMAVHICQSKGENPFEMVVHYSPQMPGSPTSVLRWQTYIEKVMEYAHMRLLFEPLLRSQGFGI